MPALRHNSLEKDAIMLIKFYDKAGDVILQVIPKSNNDWDACMEGWQMIETGLVTDKAVDFDVILT